MSRLFLSLKVMVDCSLTALGVASAPSPGVEWLLITLLGAGSWLVFLLALWSVEAWEQPESMGR